MKEHEIRNEIENAELDPLARTELMNNLQHVEKLVNEGDILLSDLLKLKHSQLIDFFNSEYSYKNLRLAKSIGIPFSYLLELNSERIIPFLEHKNLGHFLNLAKKENISVLALLELNHCVQAELLDRTNDVLQLVNRGHFCLTNLLKLEHDLLKNYFKYFHEAIRLVTSAGISVADLLKLDREAQIIVLKNSYRIIGLLRGGYEGKISAQQIYSILTQNLPTAKALEKVKELSVHNYYQDIKKYSQVLAQAYRTGTGFFGVTATREQVAPECLAKIASLLGNDPDVLEDDKVSFEIAFAHFGKGNTS